MPNLKDEFDLTPRLLKVELTDAFILNNLIRRRIPHPLESIFDVFGPTRAPPILGWCWNAKISTIIKVPVTACLKWVIPEGFIPAAAPPPSVAE